MSEKEEKEYKSYLESIGDSIVVVADDEVVKTHVHTNDPGLAIQKALTHGSLTKIKILDKEISSEQYAVGFKKGNTELKDKVQKTLDEMAEDGTVDKIAEKYADYGVPGALCIGKNSK